MISTININSHRYAYDVVFVDDPFKELQLLTRESKIHLIIDKKVRDLYFEKLNHLELASTFVFEATEENKSFSSAQQILEHLVSNKYFKNHKIVSIGGGITHDVSAFVCSVLHRGASWIYFPSTLLAMADPCIGGKSSLNIAGKKNLIGTYFPASKVFLAPCFLETLDKKDFVCGLGEIIKTKILKTPNDLSVLQQMIVDISTGKSVENVIFETLVVKKYLVEKDEFDSDVRQLLNFGHTFAHAIESATNYAVNHGTAVLIGIDMAFSYSLVTGRIGETLASHLQSLLRPIYRPYTKDLFIDLDVFQDAIISDKKNPNSEVMTILIPVEQDGDVQIIKESVRPDKQFFDFCERFISRIF